MTSFLFQWRDAVLNVGGPAAPTTRLVLVAVAQHMNANGVEAWPSLDTICTRSGLDRRTVQRHLQQAEERGWIKRGWHGDRGWSTRTYRACIPQGHQGHGAAEDRPPVGQSAAGGRHTAAGGAAHDRPTKPFTKPTKKPSRIGDLGQQLVDAYPHPTNGQRASTKPSAAQVEVWLMNLRNRPGVTLDPLEAAVQRQILTGAQQAAAVARQAPDAYRRSLKTWIHDLGWTEQILRPGKGAAPPTRRERPPASARRTDEEAWAELANRPRVAAPGPKTPKPRRRS